jgi:L-threonylcarbamoyladenylate synthase
MGQVLRVTNDDSATSAPPPAAITACVNALLSGNLVVLPTETVYGVACSLRIPSALQKLTALRPDIRLKPNGSPAPPLTVHISSPPGALAYIDPPTPWQARALRLLWGTSGGRGQVGGPIGLQFPVSQARQAEVAKQLSIDPSLLYSAQGITLRCPSHPATQAVLAATESVGSGPGQPPAIVLIQAGTPGGHPALRADDIGGDVAAACTLILDAGATRYSRPSTLVRLSGPPGSSAPQHAPERSWSVIREGVYDQRSIERMLRFNLIFVCSGNTCRSPMAAAVARDILSRELKLSPADLEAAGIHIGSAGTMAASGMPATPQGVQALAGLGIDLSSHRSRPLERGLVDTADHIVVMSENHRRLILSIQPSARDRVQMLDPDGDIEDPIGSDTAVYRKLAERMRPLIKHHLVEAGLLAGTSADALRENP